MKEKCSYSANVNFHNKNISLSKTKTVLAYKTHVFIPIFQPVVAVNHNIRIKLFFHMLFYMGKKIGQKIDFVQIDHSAGNNAWRSDERLPWNGTKEPKWKTKQNKTTTVYQSGTSSSRVTWQARFDCVCGLRPLRLVLMYFIDPGLR